MCDNKILCKFCNLEKEIKDMQPRYKNRCKLCSYKKISECYIRRNKDKFDAYQRKKQNHLSIYYDMDQGLDSQIWEWIYLKPEGERDSPRK